MEYSKISSNEVSIAKMQREAYAELRKVAREQGAKFEASLHWTTYNGKEYLVRKKGANNKVIGTRVPLMEDLYAKYNEEKAEVLQKIAKLRDEISVGRDKINRSTINLVPLDSARILRKLEEEGTLGTLFVVSGLQCIYAYESQANVRFKQNLKDKDVYNITKATEKNLVLLGTAGDERKLFDAILAIDPTYKIIGNKGRYRATNANGFSVDLVCSASDSKQNWMLSVPRVESIAFCESGLPVPFVSLAPHVYALYKFWQSKNHQDKQQAVKAEIDSKQAYAITDMVKHELGRCITEEDFSAVPDCVSAYKEQLVEETKQAFSTETFDL
jgi:hypothetical protein